MNKIKVVGYTRVSLDKQVQETEGLEIQKDRIIQFCAKNNYELIKIFSDEGVSGAKDITERPALLEMMNYCKNPPIQYVIIDKSDRLARKFENQLFVEMELQRSKVEVLYSTNETTNIDEKDTDMDKMMKAAMRQMMGIFAELDRKMTIKRLSDGLKKKAHNGYKPAGRMPFGYEYSVDSKSTLVNESQSKIIKDIFIMRSNKYSLNHIADILNTDEYYNKNKEAYICNLNYEGKKKKNTGHGWTNQSVRKILINDFYIGMVTHAREKINGNHEAIIDVNLWDKVHNF